MPELRRSSHNENCWPSKLQLAMPQKAGASKMQGSQARETVKEFSSPILYNISSYHLDIKHKYDEKEL
jgi:hypothetical protein